MPPIVEEQLDVIQKAGLVAFDGKVIMRFPCNDVLGDAALAQQGVGGDDFAADRNGFKQRDGNFDFVGAFGLVTAVYRQVADFFCA